MRWTSRPRAPWPWASGRRAACGPRDLGPAPPPPLSLREAQNGCPQGTRLTMTKGPTTSDTQPGDESLRPHIASPTHLAGSGTNANPGPRNPTPRQRRPCPVNPAYLRHSTATRFPGFAETYDDAVSQNRRTRDASHHLVTQQKVHIPHDPDVRRHESGSLQTGERLLAILTRGDIRRVTRIRL